MSREFTEEDIAVLRCSNAYVTSAWFFRRWPGEREPISYERFYEVLGERLTDRRENAVAGG